MAKAKTDRPRLRELYESKVKADLQKEFSFGNVMEIPKLEKIVLNMGVKGAVTDSKKVKKAVIEMALISGQSPVTTRAKKSIAGFKVREDMPLGCKVTLRGAKMYEFLDRLIQIALPRVRDFRGVKATSFDGRGNYALGLQEQLVFPEISYDDVDDIRGMDIIICTSAKTNEHAYALLKGFNMPFAK